MATDMQSTVTQIQNDMQRYERQLGESEYLTRKVLVDPVLELLGWKVPNPRLVEVEHQYTSRRADYALLREGYPRPVCFVEAKKKGGELRLDANKGELRTRLDEQRYYADYLILTDGNAWKVYDSTPKPIDENLRMEIQIERQDPATCTGRLQELSQLLRTLGSGKTSGSLGWAPICSISGTPKGMPRAIRFPDSEQKQTLSLDSLVEHTANWLHRQGKLRNGEEIPKPAGSRSKTPLVAAEPRGSANPSQWKPIGSSGMYAYVYKGNDHAVAIRYTKTLLSACTVDHESVYLQSR